ncbi:hypothetical protein OBBRIDRAFT_288751 [Obba rivulosa]|uniref:RING-type domain-containing protein n=1 Tax=Obba rivulosa TaxID=1052685 RepID=A0A8E2APP1_9APHY|nr:hypothetical protein OBBRIDRAFT_288751 [Obba rivulosa]
MNPQCTICLENITGDIMATRCGHLYCTECATTNFSLPSATCAICRRAWTFDELIMLYPHYGTATTTSSSDSTHTDARETLDALATDAIASCLDLLEEGDADADTRKITSSRVDGLMKALSENELAPVAHDLFQSIVSLLAEISLNVRPDIGRLRELEMECRQLEDNVCELTLQLESVTRIRDEYRRKAQLATDNVSELMLQLHDTIKERDENLQRAEEAEDNVCALTVQIDHAAKSQKEERRKTRTTEAGLEETWDLQLREMKFLKEELSAERVKVEHAERDKVRLHAMYMRYRTKEWVDARVSY